MAHLHHSPRNAHAIERQQKHDSPRISPRRSPRKSSSHDGLQDLPYRNPLSQLSPLSRRSLVSGDEILEPHNEAAPKWTHGHTFSRIGTDASGIGANEVPFVPPLLSPTRVLTDDSALDRQ